MDATFPDWFGLVSLKPSADVLGARWAAVETLASSKKRGDLLNLVRIAKGAHGVSDSIVKAARDGDAAFQTHNCEPELRVLAAAAIEKIVRGSSSPADLVALATATASFAGTQGDALFQRVRDVALEYLADESVRVRATEELSGKKREDYQPLISAFVEANQAQTPQVGALLSEITKIMAEALSQLRGEVDALREESDMVWWTFGGYSRDQNCSMRDLGLPASCLIAAKELADLTTTLPGPRSAPALLDRTLSLVESSTAMLGVEACVNATERQWRTSVVKRYAMLGLDELAPVLLANARSLETDSATDWLSAFTSKTGIANPQLSPPALAYQAYNELLLVRAATSVKA